MITQFVSPETQPTCQHVIETYGGDARPCGGPACAWVESAGVRHYRCPRHARDLTTMPDVTWGVVEVLR